MNESALNTKTSVSYGYVSFLHIAMLPSVTCRMVDHKVATLSSSATRQIESYLCNGSREEFVVLLEAPWLPNALRF